MLLEHSAGLARLLVAPELGGGIARLDVDDRPVLRPWAGDHDNPFSLASNILVPFSNRISKGGFDWDGAHYVVEKNLSGEDFPIHGDGFQHKWAGVQDEHLITLRLAHGEIGPWRYTATQEFHLSESSLQVSLEVVNRGSKKLPFGCGFHPWFPRSKNTTLRFDAKSVWLENALHLPTNERLLSEYPGWNFAEPRPLPNNFINNGFVHWAGRTEIGQGNDAVSCVVTASQNLSTAIVYSPGQEADFFCFEPVSHPVDAFHLPHHPGLLELEVNQSVLCAMSITWTVS